MYNYLYYTINKLSHAVFGPKTPVKVTASLRVAGEPELVKALNLNIAPASIVT
jgi:hypothetical protein